VFVPEGSRIEQPLHLVFLGVAADRPQVQHPRTLVVAGAGSRAALIQDHVSQGSASAFTNAVIEVYVERDAQLDLVILQRENDATFHISNLCVRLERGARCSLHTLTLGGRLVRNDVVVVLADEGADCTLNGLFIGAGDQLLDQHTVVDHAMPHGESRQLYKGILGGRARGVFRGRVIVRPDAQHTNAAQSNPNLLLTAGAEVNSKPQLEIHADDVKCNHGSSIGQLDPDALFYLRSRGLDEGRARDLLTRGFAAEILEALPVPGLAQGLEEPLLDHLRAAHSLESRA
jgi:Fe-S cluster assembly protein SufD